MPTAHRAETRYSNRTDRHQTREALRAMIHGDSTMSELFEDAPAPKPTKRQKPVSGFLPLELQYADMRTPAKIVTGPLFETAPAVDTLTSPMFKESDLLTMCEHVWDAENDCRYCGKSNPECEQ